MYPFNSYATDDQMISEGFSFHSLFPLEEDSSSPAQVTPLIQPLAPAQPIAPNPSLIPVQASPPVQPLSPARPIAPNPSLIPVQPLSPARPIATIGRFLPLLNPDMAITYLSYFEMIMHYDLKNWTAAQELLEDGQNQAMEIARRATREQQEIASAVMSLYRHEMPRLVASNERTPLLIRTFIQLIQWHSKDPSDADIQEYLNAIQKPKGHSDAVAEELTSSTAVYQFAAARALFKGDNLKAEKWLEQLFSLSSIASVEMDVLRIALAQCYWKHDKLDQCGDALSHLVGKGLSVVCQLTREDLSRRLL